MLDAYLNGVESIYFVLKFFFDVSIEKVHVGTLHSHLSCTVGGFSTILVRIEAERTS